MPSIRQVFLSGDLIMAVLVVGGPGRVTSGAAGAMPPLVLSALYAGLRRLGAAPGLRACGGVQVWARAVAAARAMRSMQRAGSSTTRVVAPG